MSEPARNRFALDLEDLERQLRGAAQAPRPGQAPDPLAELTRIVGQDDPLKDLFAGRPKPAAVQPAAIQPAWQTARQEPSFGQAPEPALPPHEAPSAAPPAEMRGALDEFEALLRRTEVARPDHIATAVAAPAYAAPQQDDFEQPEPQGYGRSVPVQTVANEPRDLDQDAGVQSYAYEPAGMTPDHDPRAEDDLPDLEPRRSRKGLWTAATLVTLGVIGVGAAAMYRSSAPTKDGLPPTISADRGPTKVEPVNPGGAEIPNQNKQIYEKVGQAQPTQTKVVTREEQPVDVQAVRTQPARVVLAGPGTGTSAVTNPLAQAPAAPERTATPSEPALTALPAVPGLGEPRKVRTVAIRPDGTPAPVNSGGLGNTAQPAVTGSAPSRPAPAVPAIAMNMPVTNAGATNNAAAVTAPRPRPATTPEPAKVQERVATPAPATTPSAPVRVASAAPAVSVPPAPATAAIRAGSGDFAVQLAAPGSESEARATFAALQRKYPDQLGSQAPIVRKTELAGGKTVFRLRVGPYSRDDATSMCTALQSAGGQCFIAKN